jgi:regulator of protease activity HflC (stomatin/prohibitin superfamily)
MAIFTFLLLGLLFILYNLLLIVPMREVCVIERLGKFRVVHQPGFHFLIPFFDRVAYRHEIREQCINIPPQNCISRDNTQIEVDGLVYIKVMDGYKASYGIEDYQRASINLAQTTMRSEVGKLTLSETFSERESLNEAIVREIDKASEPWGIKVLRYEIMNIEPSRHVIATLEKQMEAEREKRAEITLASAEREATIMLSQGERQEAINLSEGERQKRINEAEGRAREISEIAQATSEGMKLVARAISKPGGDEAMKMRLLESYIAQLGAIFRQADIAVVPAELAKLQGFFEGIDQVARATTQPGEAS